MPRPRRISRSAARVASGATNGVREVEGEEGDIGADDAAVGAVGNGRFGDGGAVAVSKLP